MRTDALSGSDPAVKPAAVLETPAEICLPVTVRMLDFVAVSQHDTLILVGCVEAAKHEKGVVQFIINDATGRLQVHLFLDPFCKDTVNLKAGEYVSIQGRVASTPFPRHFIAYGFHYVNSPDAVSYHNIEVAHAYLMRKHKRPHTS